MKIYNEEEYEVITQKVLNDTATNEELAEFKSVVDAWNISAGTQQHSLNLNQLQRQNTIMIWYKLIQR